MTSQFHRSSKTQNPVKPPTMLPQAHPQDYKGDIVFYVTPTKDTLNPKIPDFEMNLYENSKKTEKLQKQDLSSIVENSNDSGVCIDNCHTGSPTNFKEIFQYNHKILGSAWEGQANPPKKNRGLLNILGDMRRPLPGTYRASLNEVLATEKLINQRKFNDSVNNSSFRKRAKDTVDKNLLFAKRRRTNPNVEIEYVGPSINNFKIKKTLRKRCGGKGAANVWKFDKKNCEVWENKNLDAVQYSAMPDRKGLVSTAGQKGSATGGKGRGFEGVGGGSEFCDTDKLNITNYNFNRHRFCFDNRYEMDTVKSNVRKLMRKTFNRTMSPLTFDKFNSSADLRDPQPYTRVKEYGATAGSLGWRKLRKNTLKCISDKFGSSSVPKNLNLDLNATPRNAKLPTGFDRPRVTVRNDEISLDVHEISRDSFGFIARDP